PLSPEAGVWLKALKALIVERAEQLGIPSEILVRKKPLEALLRSGFPRGGAELPEVLSGWRKEVIGDTLVAQIEALAKPA
ncbi:MAG: ribonuclease D, partial [Pseudomonadota bacterium]